jgi:hypothetical protein
MRKNFIIILTTVIINIGFALISIDAQAVHASVRGSVSSSVDEASGIDFTGGSSFWTHNDGYGDNKLYKLNSTGSLTRTLTVSNATNYDWEDITSDKQKDNMYIGDFGNNNCDRTNLKIYKIPYPSTVSGNTVTASVIRFSYPDQHRFPSRWMNFDVEGFFHYNGLLYLFTKADGNGIGNCKLYTIPDDPGTYVATLVDSFHISGRITGADISPDGKSVVLISNTKIYLFNDFSGVNVFNGDYTKISIDGGWTQKEGVCFYSNSLIYLIDEGSSNKLYSVDLSPYLPAERVGSPVADLPEEEDEITNTESTPLAISIYPNPAQSFFVLRAEENFTHVDVVITDLSGKLISQIPIDNPDVDIRIDAGQYPAGFYLVQIIGDNQKRSAVQRLVLSR